MSKKDPSLIRVNSRPGGIITLSRKALAVVAGLLTIFVMTLAWGVIKQKQNMQSGLDDGAINSAMNQSLKEKLDQVPDHAPIAKADPVPPTIIDNTKIYPAPETPITNKRTPVEKPKGPSLRDILAQRKFMALEQAVSGQSGGSASKPAAPSKGGNQSVNVAGVGGIPPEHLKALMAGAAGDNDPNKQLRKESFLQTDAARDYANGTLQSTRMLAASPYLIRQGGVFPAVMVGGLNSDLPGYIKAMVTENVYDTATGDHLLIPKGSQLVGVYDSRVAYGQTRALVVWRRVIFPDASAMDLENMPGMDEGGFAGLHDKVNNHYMKVFGAGLILSLFQAGYDISTDKARESRYPSASDTAAEAVSKQFAQIGMEYARRGLNIQPTIEIRNGKQFNVFVHKDIVFKEAYEHRFADVVEYESKLY